MKLDRIDKHILELLQQDARLTNTELADKVGLSATPCARRVKQLEEEGLIAGYSAVINEEILGLTLTAFISISMDRHTPERLRYFEDQVKTFPEVAECHLLTGQSADYLLKAHLPDMSYYESFLLNRLTKIEGVSGVHSSFLLRKVVDRNPLPLAHIKDG